jgi:hypothetical protein
MALDISTKMQESQNTEKEGFLFFIINKEHLFIDLILLDVMHHKNDECY